MDDKEKARMKELHNSADILLAWYLTEVKNSSIDDSIYSVIKWAHGKLTE